MTEKVPESVTTAFETRGSFEAADVGWTVTTTPFEATVTVTDTDGEGTTYAVTVRMPTLDNAADGSVGEAVQRGWLDALERRLEDAPQSTRATVELDAFTVETADGAVTVTYEFTLDDPRRGADIAKTFVEFVEGTYVQGVVPGYDYQPPVSDLLHEAQQSDSGPGGTPL